MAIQSGDNGSVDGPEVLAGSETRGDLSADGHPVDALSADRGPAIDADRFEDFFDLCRDMLCFAGTDGYFKRVNLAFVRALGYTEEELMAQPFLEFVHPDDREDTIAELSNLSIGQESKNFENRYRTKDGRFRWIEWSARPVSDGQVYAVARDVTESRHALTALRESEQRFRDIAENISEVFYLFDGRSEQVQYVSPAFEKVWGIPRERLYRDWRAWLQLISPRHRERVEASWMEGQRTSSPYNEEYSIERPDGSVRYILDRAFPIQDSDGHVTRTVGIAEDITRRREAERTARERESELAHVSRLSTMGEMASGIAHELNQPLSAIAIHSETCRMSLSTGKLERAIEDLDAIAEQTERAGQILRRLRHFVRKHEPTSSDIDVARMVRDVVKFMEFELNSTGTELQLDLDPEVAVSGDLVQLQQVLVNLLQNAIQALDGCSERKIEIRSNVTGAEAWIRVGDNGPGMTESEIDRMFEPFYTTKQSGLGIGLPFSQSIVNAHGGTLRAESRANGGMMLSLSLPRLERDGEAERRARASGRGLE